MSEYIIEMNHITKRFPGIVANDDISIQIKKGEIYAILGENGAGKSTLMSMLFGMYEPDEGEIVIRGEKVRIESPNHATRLNIGMVHQHFKLVSNYTIAENIVMGMEPVKKTLGIFKSLDQRRANEEIRALSEKFGLEVDPTKVIELEILKMLYREAEILIFDEPTAVLTPQEIEFLLEIIEGLRRDGKTIILITHKLEEIKKIADRCAILCRGKLIDVLDVKETDTKTMANLMVGREVNFSVDKPKAHFGEEILKVEHLTVQNEDKFEVVKDVSFSVRGGEIFAVAGVSGNGQVELADAVAGLLKPSHGRILLNGKDITQSSIRSRNLEGMSYIPEDRQNVGLVMDMSLSDNLALKNYFEPPFSKGAVIDGEEFVKYSDRLIEKYDIRSGQGSDTIVRSMSGGNQQKAVIAREIELDSSLLIFVQPTRGLDIGAIENIHRQIVEQRNRGKAVLLISLELDEVMNLADTIGVIYNGKIEKIADAGTLTPGEVGEFMMGVGGRHEKA